MCSDEHAICLRRLSKHYMMFDRPEDRLKQMVVPRLRKLVGLPPKNYFREFAAVHNVSFAVRRGETVGVVGRNGSGKSTLLQLVCGTLRPSSGDVAVRGRIAALLELGAGFNREFTGRENVYTNGAILGLSRAEIDERYESIVSFADIGPFIDRPVKTYSSGMYVRLAFATAINVDPDILVVDEALSVGDEAFQRKCFARLDEIQQRGGTILFVSHNAQAVVQLCTRAVLLERGELLLEGDPKSVVSQYQRLVNLSGAAARALHVELREMRDSGSLQSTNNLAATAPREESIPAPATVNRGPSLEAYDPNLVSQSRVEYEERGARIRDVRLLGAGGEPLNILESGRQYQYEYVVEFSRDAQNVLVGMLVKSITGVELSGANNRRVAEPTLAFVRAGTTLRVSFTFTCELLDGTYFVNAGVMGTVAGESTYMHRILDAVAIRVKSDPRALEHGYFGLKCELETEVINAVGSNEPTAHSRGASKGDVNERKVG